MTYDISGQISKRVQKMPPSGIRAFFELVIGMKDIISLGVGEPDFDTPWSVREAAIYSIERGETTYTSNKGLLELRKLINRHLIENFSVEYNPEDEILITVGVSEGMDLAIRALINPGDKVIVPEPCYVSYHPMVYLAGGEPLYLSTKSENGFKVQPKEIEAFAKLKPKAIILNYPSNPTGASYSREELLGIAKACKKLDLTVISDEIYSDLSYETPHISLTSLPGMKERTLLLNGFSKGYAMTGWRIGYAAGPRELMDAMNKIHQYTIMCAPIMGQWAACEALKNSQGAVQSMKKEYLLRRNLIVDGLNDIGLKCHKPEGAFYAFPSIKSSGMDSMTFAKKLLEKEKVAVVPGTAFGPSGEGFIRMAYATALDQIKEAIKRMENFLKSCTGT
jgi:aminotransferase